MVMMTGLLNSLEPSYDQFAVFVKKLVCMQVLLTWCIQVKSVGGKNDAQLEKTQRLGTMVVLYSLCSSSHFYFINTFYVYEYFACTYVHHVCA